MWATETDLVEYLLLRAEIQHTPNQRCAGFGCCGCAAAESRAGWLSGA
jgi:hypothetical protein